MINEIFPNPTIKRVMFEITFPNLFYLENKIGDFQMKIMKKFPRSALIYRRQILFADIGPGGKLEDIDQKTGKKIWQFESDNDIILSVTENSLDMSSNNHKTYNLESEYKLRDTIKFIIDNFLSIIPIPVVNRIGLRYINECPIPSMDNETFESFYSSTFPLDKFDLSNVDESESIVVIKRDNYFIRHLESLKKIDDRHILILDFDASIKNIEPENYLTTTDILHDIISVEFERTIKGPIYEYMRRIEES